jgi:hypothetical protein
MWWMGGHVAGMEKKQNAYKVLVGRLKERDHFETYT